MMQGHRLLSRARMVRVMSRLRQGDPCARRLPSCLRPVQEYKRQQKRSLTDVRQLDGDAQAKAEQVRTCLSAAAAAAGGAAVQHRSSSTQFQAPAPGLTLSRFVLQAAEKEVRDHVKALIKPRFASRQLDEKGCKVCVGHGHTAHRPSPRQWKVPS